MHNLNQLKLFLCVKWYAIANCKPEKEVINKKRISFPSKKKRISLKKILILYQLMPINLIFLDNKKLN